LPIRQNIPTSDKEKKIGYQTKTPTRQVIGKNRPGQLTFGHKKMPGTISPWQKAALL